MSVGAVQRPQPLQVLHGQYGVAQADLPAAIRPRLKEVPFRSRGGDRVGDQLLADGVDRGIGDLREELLEVVVEQLGRVGQSRGRRVVAHRADRLIGGARHRRQDHAQFLERVSEGALPVQQIGAGHARRLLPGRQVVEVHQVLAQPQPVVLCACDLGLEFGVVDDAALLGVDQQHAARPQAVLEHDLVGRQVEHADLGGQHHQAAPGHAVPGRPQSVTVQHRADLPAVGERDRRRSVPGLHQAGVVLVERPLLRAHAFVVRPRLRDQHHEGVRQRTSAQHHQLEGAVQLGGVAARRLDHRQRGGQVVAEQLRAQQRLAGAHPVLVALQGVDLAVVHEVAVRMRPVPTREGVGREAGVHQRDRRLDRRMLELRVERAELQGGEHALEDDGAVRKAGDVEAAHGLWDARPHPVLDQLADHVQTPLEGVVIVHAPAAGDEHLTDVRLLLPRRAAQTRPVGRHVAPAQQRLPLLGDHLRDDAVNPHPKTGVGGQEAHADAVLPGAGKLHPRLARQDRERRVRDLDQHAGAVPGVRVAAQGATVVEVGQHLQGIVEQPARSAAVHVDDETDPAGVVLIRRVVQTLRGRDAGETHDSISTDCTTTFFRSALWQDDRRSAGKPYHGA